VVWCETRESIKRNWLSPQEMRITSCATLEDAEQHSPAGYAVS
jgi:hypothetical protein